MELLAAAGASAAVGGGAAATVRLRSKMRLLQAKWPHDPTHDRSLSGTCQGLYSSLPFTFCENAATDPILALHAGSPLVHLRQLLSTAQSRSIRGVAPAPALTSTFAPALARTAAATTTTTTNASGPHGAPPPPPIPAPLGTDGREEVEALPYANETSQARPLA